MRKSMFLSPGERAKRSSPLRGHKKVIGEKSKWVWSWSGKVRDGVRETRREAQAGKQWWPRGAGMCSEEEEMNQSNISTGSQES
jgi:hypothetical protein